MEQSKKHTTIFVIGSLLLLIGGLILAIRLGLSILIFQTFGIVSLIIVKH